MKAMRKQSGFTTIELIIAVLLLCAIGALFMLQKNEADTLGRDTKRKTAINAMYYNLQEVYFPTQKFYPRVIDATNLTAMDPQLLKDPKGVLVGQRTSDYRYQPTGCDGDKCSGFVLRALLEKEEDFVKQSF